jgi:hypothetical protein
LNRESLQGEKMNPNIAGKIIANFKQEYTRPAAEASQRFSESMMRIIQKLQKPGGTVQRFMDDIVQMINRNYRIREVSIGRRSQQDGKYRYVSLYGFRKDAELSLRGLVYEEKDFSQEYVGRQISDWTWAFLSEDKPFVAGEETTYNRPIMLGKGGRTSLEQCLEADYFDTRIIGERNRLIGWIEYSGTTDYLFPDIRTIKEIELIGGILAFVFENQNQPYRRQI